MAKRYSDRCDRGRIPCILLWRREADALSAAKNQTPTVEKMVAGKK